VSTLQTTAALAVAVSDLKVVQLLRAAMRAADRAGSKLGSCGPLQCDDDCCNRRCDHFHPEPRYEPRVVYHPTPRYEPRPVIHPTPRIGAMQVPIPEPVERPHDAGLSGVLPPPWKTPVWKMPIPVAPDVKVYLQRVDVQNKGSLLDFFL
jgi:hypothetical protein